MKEIHLSNSSAVALVDDEDYELLTRWTWHEEKDGYARRCGRRNGIRFNTTMHRQVMNAPNPASGTRVSV